MNFIVALVVVIVTLFLMGLVVCTLAMVFESLAIAFVGAAVGLPFAFFAGYLVAKKILAD